MRVWPDGGCAGDGTDLHGPAYVHGIQPRDELGRSGSAGRVDLVGQHALWDRVSRREFGDIEAHVEFMVSKDSNSGVYLMGRYEVQVYDSWQKQPEYPGIECGGIYQRWDESKNPKGFEVRLARGLS